MPYKSHVQIKTIFLAQVIETTSAMCRATELEFLNSIELVAVYIKLSLRGA